MAEAREKEENIPSSFRYFLFEQREVVDFSISVIYFWFVCALRLLVSGFSSFHFVCLLSSQNIYLDFFRRTHNELYT